MFSVYPPDGERPIRDFVLIVPRFTNPYNETHGLIPMTTCEKGNVK